eukprot:TRINITY_DN16239_c0_g1_i1.p1 TRINITY_DN16239_c0_g1~~TRINITY_DN16239_c0_g1_i1.p1  ORF type:complete len:441 (-),score=50.16 TRINITY_DN16239_c0_g1_i1:10-1332(-)
MHDRHTLGMTMTIDSVRIEQSVDTYLSDVANSDGLLRDAEGRDAVGERTITVLSITGETLASIQLRSGASVAHLKAEIAEATGIVSAQQILTIGEKVLTDGEQIWATEFALDVTVVLIVRGSPPICIGPGKYLQRSFEITAVRVQNTDVQAELDESPLSILQRVKSRAEENQDDHSRLLFWSLYPLEGESAIRDRLVDLIPSMSSHALLGKDCIDGTVAVLNLRPNPGELPSSSLLYGLLPGNYFATHELGDSVSCRWGWLRLGRSEDDTVCGLRLMQSAPCGNTRPCGIFLLEFLGSAHRAPVPAAALEVAQIMASAMIRDQPEAGAADRPHKSIKVHLLHLRRGRMTVHSHSPAEAVQKRFVPEWALLLATFPDGREFIILLDDGLAATLGTPMPPSELAGTLLLRQSPGYAHVSSTPTRFDPNWLQLKILNAVLYGQ